MIFTGKLEYVIKHFNICTVDTGQSTQCQCRLDNELIESSPANEGLQIFMDAKLGMN